MAGHAAKKLAKEADIISKIYFTISIVLTGAYFLLNVLMVWSTITKSKITGFLFLSLVNYITYTGIRDASALGVDYSYYQDIYIINAVVQCTTLFWNAGWYIYVVVPGYLIYKFGRLIRDWAFTRQPEHVETEADIKRREKKDRQAKRGKMQIIR